MSSDVPQPISAVPAKGETRLRVRYSECDPMGVTHHGSYAHWLEIGRTELLRVGGVTYRALEDAGVLLVVTRLDIRYKKPARYDDEIVVVTEVTGGGRARIDHGYEVWLDAGDGRGKSDLLATAASTIACVGRDGRPTALPDWLRADRHNG